MEPRGSNLDDPHNFLAYLQTLNELELKALRGSASAILKEKGVYCLFFCYLVLLIQVKLYKKKVSVLLIVNFAIFCQVWIVIFQSEVSRRLTTLTYHRLGGWGSREG
jgi:hypothetical protein